MNHLTQRHYVVLAGLLTLGVAVLDLALPPQVETDFFFVFPLLLCQKTCSRRLVFGLAAFALVWTILTNVFPNESLNGLELIYAGINDLLGMISVWAVAFFVSKRIKTESDLNSMIDFIDGRLGTGEDNEHLRQMK